MSDIELEPRVCGRIGCGGYATHLAGLLLRAFPKSHAFGVAAPAYLSLPLCPAHAHALIPEDVISDAGWEQVCQGFEAAGKMRPKRKYAEAFATPIDECPDAFRNRFEPGKA